MPLVPDAQQLELRSALVSGPGAGVPTDPPGLGRAPLRRRFVWPLSGSFGPGPRCPVLSQLHGTGSAEQVSFPTS